MTDTLEKHPYELESIILEDEVKGALEVLGRNKPLEEGGIPIELFQVTEIESTEILTKICQKT